MLLWYRKSHAPHPNRGLRVHVDPFLDDDLLCLGRLVGLGDVLYDSLVFIRLVGRFLLGGFLLCHYLPSLRPEVDWEGRRE